MIADKDTLLRDLGKNVLEIHYQGQTQKYKFKATRNKAIISETSETEPVTDDSQVAIYDTHAQRWAVLTIENIEWVNLVDNWRGG